MKRQILYGSDFEFSPESEQGMYEGTFDEYETGLKWMSPIHAGRTRKSWGRPRQE